MSTASFSRWVLRNVCLSALVLTLVGKYLVAVSVAVEAGAEEVVDEVAAAKAPDIMV